MYTRTTLPLVSYSTLYKHKLCLHTPLRLHKVRRTHCARHAYISHKSDMVHVFDTSLSHMPHVVKELHVVAPAPPLSCAQRSRAAF